MNKYKLEIDHISNCLRRFQNADCTYKYYEGMDLINDLERKAIWDSDISTNEYIKLLDILDNLRYNFEEIKKYILFN